MPSYWQRPGHGRATNADAFRIYESNRIVGERSWGANTGMGTMKGRQAPVALNGDYTCSWSDYSALPGPRGTVPAPDAHRAQRGSDRLTNVPPKQP